METIPQKPTENGQPGSLRSGDLFGVWVPVAERLPKAGQRVLVTALNGIYVWRTVAQYWPAGTMDASNWDDPPEDWWDKVGDKCTNPEPGWYESQIEAEVSYELTGVAHWMPLPPSPNAEMRHGAQQAD